MLIRLRRVHVIVAVLSGCSALPAFAADPAAPAVSEIRGVLAEKGSASVIVEMALPEDSANDAAAPQALTRSRVQSLIMNQRARVARASTRMRGRAIDSGITMEQTYENLPVFVTTVNAVRLAKLLSLPEVSAVYLNKARRAGQVPQGSPFGNAKKLTPVLMTAGDEEPAAESNDRAAPQLDDSTEEIRADEAWAAGVTGSGQAVVILDTGINRTHQMFTGKIVSEACYSPKNGTDEESLCPIGTSSTATNSASNCTAHADACDHGSHVAGIAAGNDATAPTTLRGVAYQANLIPIQVFTIVNDDSEDGCDGDAPCLLAYDSAQLSALNRTITLAATLDIAAVNLSLGGEPQTGTCNGESLKTAIDALRNLGILTAIAAGNDGEVGKTSPPGCISTAITVSSVNGSAPDTSVNHSSIVDVLAPGVSIRSASGSGTNSYVFASGTSMATPHVAGAIALLKSADPDATAAEIESALESGGIPTTRSNWSWTTPRLDVKAALDILDGGGAVQAQGVAVVGVFPDANPLADSYLRFHNPNSSAGTVTVQIFDEDTGEFLSTWTKSIPARAAVQYVMSEIEQGATPPVTPASTTTTYTLYVDAAFSNGHVQHVLWDTTTNALTNVSGCAAGVSTDVRNLIDVHSALIQGYPSYILIHNTGTAPATATFTVRNARTGVSIGTYTFSPAIPAHGTGYLPSTDVSTGTAPVQDHLNFVMNSSFTGFAQHIVDNQIARVITNMTPKCDM